MIRISQWRNWSKMNSDIRVFKEDSGFIKLFHLFKDKYRSLGRIGGTVSIKDFTDKELETIAGFLGCSKENLIQKGSISLTEFEKELSKTSFSQYTILPLIEEVLQQKILSKKEELQKEKDEEASFINSLIQVIPNAQSWLQWIAKKSSDTRWIWSQFKQNKEELHEKIVTVFRAFTNLPGEGEFERLPLFSQRVTGNPHYFDQNEIAGKLLHHCMYVDQVCRGNISLMMPKTVEELNDLLSEYGILRDDLWNFVTCQQLLAANGNDEHPVWKEACQSNSVLNMPMKELMKVNRIWPANGKMVWVLENSSVCSLLMDALPNAPIICTHGQLRMASWRLLDLLVESNCRLYYSGDLDPEGLIIAERVKKRYKEHVVLWRMDVDSYKISLSNEDISNRLSKIENITSPELMGTTEMMNSVKKAGYQEALVNEFIKDIEKETCC